MAKAKNKGDPLVDRVVSKKYLNLGDGDAEAIEAGLEKVVSELDRNLEESPWVSVKDSSRIEVDVNAESEKKTSKSKRK